MIMLSPSHQKGRRSFTRHNLTATKLGAGKVFQSTIQTSVNNINYFNSELFQHSRK